MLVWVGHSCPTPLTLILILQVPAQSFAIPWRSGASAPRKALTNDPRLQPLRYHRQLCHPERSKRIRLMNPHAQSKDPCTCAHASAISGSLSRSRWTVESWGEFQARHDSGIPPFKKNEDWGTRSYHRENHERALLLSQLPATGWPDWNDRKRL